MSNSVKLKRSSVAGKVPTTSDLALGELALNTNDGLLFFKKSVSDIESVVTLVTLNGSQTLTNKALTSPQLTTPTLNNAILSGTLTASSSVGTNGQVLASTGVGVQWISLTANTLDGLTDVTISDPTAQQVLKYNGSQWINADNDVAVASAVFAAQAQSDLGSVTDLIIGITEDLGFIDDVAAFIYDMGQLRLDGIVSLNNLDQSVKADYIGYSIIFGF